MDYRFYPHLAQHMPHTQAMTSVRLKQEPSEAPDRTN